MTSSHEPYYLLNSSVKGLTRIQGATTLPSIYITRSPVAAKSELVVKEEIPKIDLSLLRNGAPDDRSRIIRDIGRACKDWGCFIIVNHGIPEKLQRAMIEAFAGFFNLTEQEKEVYTVKNNFESVRHGTSINLRLDDVRFWRDFLTISVYPVFHFPDKPMDFRKVSEEFTRQTREICTEMMIAILKNLELEENFMEESLDFASCVQFFVGNLYPPCPQAELVMGLPPHRDPSFITLLMQNDASFNGLQVLHDDKWVIVDLNPPSFLLLIGDIIEIVSNKRYKGAVHRAMVSNERTRITVATSLTPAENFLLSPAPKLLESSDSTPGHLLNIG